MKRVAIFISGRLTCYETHLIKNLQLFDTMFMVDLFISINGTRDEYHVQAEEQLKKWLREIAYEEYKAPSESVMIPNIHPETLFQIHEGRKVPYTNLSCFYNDAKAYNLIKLYSQNNNIQYDICMKFRPDIYFLNDSYKTMPLEIQNSVLYSCIPPCEIYIWCDRRAPRCICDAFAYGSMEVMEQYCNTYSFIIKTNNENGGNYRINYEPCLTESFFNYALDLEKDNYQTILNMFSNAKYKVQYFNVHYDIDKNRRNRDQCFTECTRGKP